MAILELLKKGDFAAAHRELAELGSECMQHPDDYALQTGYTDLRACVAYYAALVVHGTVTSTEIDGKYIPVVIPCHEPGKKL